jgi:hypothetical protein
VAWIKIIVVKPGSLVAKDSEGEEVTIDDCACMLHGNELIVTEKVFHEMSCRKSFWMTDYDLSQIVG